MNAHTLHACAGEAQKIDRIMEKFAERYCRDNPGAFGSADAAYLLAFALIMLNTDAHNPHADRKLGPQDFVAMCQVQVCTCLVAGPAPCAMTAACLHACRWRIDYLLFIAMSRRQAVQAI
jgi:hypothetical protein